MSKIQKGPADKPFRVYSKPYASESALGSGTVKRSFLADISLAHLERLRIVVRKVHLRHYRGPITLRKIDMIIESLGPAVRERLLKLEVDRVIDKMKNPERAADPDVSAALSAKHALMTAPKRFLMS